MLPRRAEELAREWLIAGGEMGDLIRATDWSETLLGPRDAWPEALRAVVNLVVASRSPMALLWGRELIFIYNDAYREIAGDKHPRAVGRSTREIWPEVWHINEPIFAAVMERGESVYLEDALFRIHRHGAWEDAYFTLCYSPVRVEDGTIGGTLVTLQETTPQVTERRRLVADRERTLETFEHGEACIVLDPEYRVVLVNVEQERLSGKPRTETMGRLLWEVWPDHADPENPFRRAWDRAIRQRRPANVEAFYDARATWLDVRIHPTADGGAAAFFHDVTDRRRAEEAVRTSEADLARAQAMAHLGSWRWDVVHDAVSWSDELYRIFGVDPATFVPSNDAARDRIHPDDRERHAQHVVTALSGAPVEPFESRVVRPSGEERVVLASGFDLERDASGRPTALFGTILDITDRKRAEEALRESEQRLRIALDAASFGTFDFDVSSGRAHWDPQMKSIWGLPAEAEDPPLAQVLERVHADDRERTRAVFEAALAPTSDGRYRSEYRLVWPDGSIHWSRAQGRVYFQGDGEHRRAVRVVGVESEITESKRAESALRDAYERLHDADRRKGEFLSAASHELRTPLATLRIHADSLARLLSEGRADDARVRRKLDSMNGQLDRLQALINALLDVTRISAGRLQLESHSCDLAQLAAEAVERFEDPAERAGVKLSLHAASALGRWDPIRMDQVLTNLLDNALKHAPGSRIDVVVRPDGSHAVLTVRDYGPGISQESQARIFQQYERAAEARVFGGLGLGLWITRQIVEAHGGTISVESAPGAGSTFTVRLPVRETR